MKKIVISLGLILLLLWSVYNKNTGQYSGSYNFKQDANIVLNINDDLSFVMYHTAGKGCESIQGHYEVDNDNNITLVPEKDSTHKALIGKVKGSVIEMTSMNGEFIKK